jgi:hypothetical protein
VTDVVRPAGNMACPVCSGSGYRIP